MRFQSFLPVALAVAGANAAPQKIDFKALAPVKQGPQSVPVGLTAQIISYDPTAARSSVAAAVTAQPAVSAAPAKRDAEVIAARTNGNCATQPASVYTGPTPADDSDSFLAFQPFADAANNAAVPAGYAKSFTNLHASSNAMKYMGFTQLSSYDTASCASQCSSITGCSAINIFFERDPTLDPGANCSNPPSMTNVRCVFWGGEVIAATATNTGETRANFTVVVAGSNGYNLLVLTTPTGYNAPQGLPAAINAPLDCNGADTFLGSRFFTDTPFDVSLCTAACDATTNYDLAHPPATGSPKTCQFVNTYILYLNGVAQGQACSMYTESWDASYAVNTGYYSGSDHYTIGASYSLSNSANPNYAANCVVSSSSSSSTTSSVSTSASAVSTTLSTITTTTTSKTTTASSTTSSSPAASDPVNSKNLGSNYAYFTNPNLNTGNGYPQFDITSFNGKNPIFTGTTDRIGFANTAPSSNAVLYPGALSRSVEQLAIVHTGYVYARTAGAYTFSVSSFDDIVFGWVGSNAFSSYSTNADLVAAYFGIAGTVTSVTKTVSAGSLIPFKFLWANGANNGNFGCTIKGPDGSVLLSSTASSAKDIITTPPPGSSVQSFSFPAVQAISTTCKAGFTYNVYKNPFKQTSDSKYTTFNPGYFATQSPISSGTIGNLNVAQSSSQAAQQQAYVFQGFFAPSTAGWYGFTLQCADDIAYLYFGDGAGNRYNSTNSVAVASYGSGASKTFSFYSPAGQLVPVTVVYANAGGAAAIQLTVQDPSGTVQKDTTNYFKSGVC